MRRGGFTLIELLVVIAIIGVLASLTVAGVFKVVDSRRRSNTESATQTVHGVLQSHWKFVIEEAKKESDLSPVLGLADNDLRRARAIWIKLRLIEAFPRSFAEINNPTAATNPIRLIPSARRKYTSTYQRAIAQRSVAFTLPANESAACLLLALSVPRGGQTLQLENLSSSAMDTDNDGIKELVDGWGRALTFFRFPTGHPGLTNPNPANPFCDPADPDGTLVKWAPSPSKQAALEAFFNNEFTILATPTSARFHAPTLVSAGPDELLGLDGQMGVSNAAQEGDNIYSFKLR
jgi:prepilin-type N-terminal cleavage/methylation domain-containing protein